MFQLPWPSSCFPTHQALSRAWLFFHVLERSASLHCLIQIPPLTEALPDHPRPSGPSHPTSFMTPQHVPVFIILLNLPVYFPVSLKLL